MTREDFWFLIGLSLVSLINLIVGGAIIYWVGAEDYFSKFLQRNAEFAWYEQTALINLCLGIGFLFIIWGLLETVPRLRTRKKM